MFLTLDKFERRVSELGRRRYFSHRCIAPFISMEGNLPKDESYLVRPEADTTADLSPCCMWMDILIRVWTPTTMKLFSGGKREKRYVSHSFSGPDWKGAARTAPFSISVNRRMWRICIRPQMSCIILQKPSPVHSG